MILQRIGKFTDELKDFRQSLERFSDQLGTLSDNLKSEFAHKDNVNSNDQG